MYIELSLSGFKYVSSKNATIREHKGKSLIGFPPSYCVIDVETTGLDTSSDKIIEMSAIKVVDGDITNTFTSLANIGGIELDPYITDLTGITNEMLLSAPPLDTVLTDFLNFVGDDIIVGHNVNFDVNFIYDAGTSMLNKYFANNFIDTLRIARKLLPDLKNHKLSTLAEHYNIDYSKAHRALADCYITNNVFKSLHTDVLNQYGTSENFTDLFKRKSHNVKASEITAQTAEFDETHPLYKKVCVFTGTLEKMPRKEAMQIVADLGGICGSTVTQKTNYLILGNNDYCPTIKDGKSAKQKKAEDLKSKGQDIVIISENTFYDMIADN